MSQSMIWMLTAVVGETLLLVLVLLALSWFRNRAARRRDAKAMHALVARIRKGRADREAVLSQFLADNFGLEGQALSAATIELLRGELKMLQRFIGVYGSRDAGAAAQFDTDAAAAFEPYHALSGTADPVGADAADDLVDSAQLDALKKENQRLSDELRITMETMSRMLNEYSTMFSGAPADAAAPINPPHAGSASAEDPAAADVVVEATTDPAPDASTDSLEDVDVSVEWDESAEQDMADSSAGPEAVAPDAADPPAAVQPAAVDDLGSDGPGAAAIAEDADLFEAADTAATVPDPAPHASAPAADTDAVVGSADHEADVADLLAELEATGEIAPGGTGADLEVSSGLLVDDEPAPIAADPSDSQAPAGQATLFDAEAVAEAASFFDQAESTDQVAPAHNAADSELLAEASVDEQSGPSPTAAAQAAPVDNDTATASLFDELAVDEVAPTERGTDVEVMSELLLEGESELVAADATDVEEIDVPSGLFDSDDELFDAVADGQADGGLAEDAGPGNLFDADEPSTAEREKTG